MFDFDDPIFIKIMEVGDVVEITNPAGTYAMVATELDMTPGGKRSLKNMYKNLIVPGKIQARIGKFEPVEDFILMSDEDEVFVQFSAKDGDIATDEKLAKENVFPRVTVEVARAVKSAQPHRKFYKFI